MSWSDVASVAEKLAPMIATGIGGPLAGGAVAALEGVFGITSTPNQSVQSRVDAVANAIQTATPAQLSAMQTADQQYALDMAKAGFQNQEQLAAIAEQDTASARTMQATTKSMVPAVLTYFITVGFFGLLVIMFFVNVPEANKAIVYSAVGTLGTAWIVCTHFWFGDTQASARKTEIIAQANGLSPDGTVDTSSFKGGNQS